MGNCTRCLNFEGALFKDIPYAKDTCKVTSGEVKYIIQDCSAFKDRGKVSWSKDLKETYEYKGNQTYKTITRTTDGEKIRLKAVGIDWIEVNDDGVPIFTSIQVEGDLSRSEVCQHRANLLAKIEEFFSKKKGKKKAVIDSRAEDLI